MVSIDEIADFLLRIHSFNGTGKPILSVRCKIVGGSVYSIAFRSRCFIRPSLNLMFEGAVAANSTIG